MRVEHYKGGIYEIICIGRSSETFEWLVTYKSCSDGQIWIRPYEVFFELIDIPNCDKPGTLLDRIPRFRIIYADEKTKVLDRW